MQTGKTLIRLAKVKLSAVDSNLINYNHFLPRIAAILLLLSANDPLVRLPPTGLEEFTLSPVKTIVLLFDRVYSRFGPLTAFERSFEECGLITGLV